MRAKRTALHDKYSGHPRVQFDLARNELHLDPLPQVRTIFESSIGSLNRYPPAEGVARLAAQIGALHDVPPEHVVIGPGSVGVLDALLHTESQAGRSTLFAIPNFDEYPVLISRAGGIPVGVAGGSSDRQCLASIVERVDVSTRQVIITAPHNPTGATVSLDELAELRRGLPDTVLLIVDQAYAEFDETMPPDVVRRIVTGLDNVVVLRSFSKAYGLAGLRIGYGVFSSAARAARVRAAVPAFAVNAVALVAAEESLRHQKQLQDRVSRVIESRRRLEAALRDHDLFSGTVSQGNFVWLPTWDSNSLFKHALADGILLREYPGLGVRITVQSDASVDAVVQSLSTYSARRYGGAWNVVDA